MSQQMPTEARLFANKECCFGVIGNSGGTGAEAMPAAKSGKSQLTSR